MKTLVRFALALILTYPALSSAGLVQFNAFLDISGCLSGGPSLCFAVSPNPTVSVAVGDTVDYTVTFGGARLRMFDDDGGEEGFAAWLFNAQTVSFFTITNASIEFLGLDGTLVNPLFIATQTDGEIHLGPNITADYIGTGESISIAGYRVRFTVDALDVNPNAYDTIAILTGADRMEVTTSAPEPGTAALVGLGLMGLVLARRRRG